MLSVKQQVFIERLLRALHVGLMSLTITESFIHSTNIWDELYVKPWDLSRECREDGKCPRGAHTPYILCSFFCKVEILETTWRPNNKGIVRGWWFVHTKEHYYIMILTSVYDIIVTERSWKWNHEYRWFSIFAVVTFTIESLRTLN